MKRYLLFGYDGCYPSGGANDLLNSFESIEELEGWLGNEMVNDKLGIYYLDYFQILNLQTNETYYIDDDKLKELAST